MSPNTPPRVPGCPYTGLARYFLTICTFNRAKRFGSPDEASAIVAQISPFFERRGFSVIAYCLMPDHLHLLVEGTVANADVVEATRMWKQQTGFAWKQRTGSRLWQKGFHDRVLRTDDDTASVVRYILENPVRAGLVRTAMDYAWLGSSRYQIAELLVHAGEWRPGWRWRRSQG